MPNPIDSKATQVFLATATSALVANIFINAIFYYHFSQLQHQVLNEIKPLPHLLPLEHSSTEPTIDTTGKLNPEEDVQ